MIADARINEKGTVSGGTPGNQNGTELQIHAFYNKPWNKVLRPIHTEDATNLCYHMVQAVRNPNIGYCQAHRESLYDEAQKVGFRLGNISSACECDCSSLIAVVCAAAGIQISKSVYTGNLAAALLNTGKFTVITEDIDKEDYLKPGDILLSEFHHVAINLGYGVKTGYDKGWHYDQGGWWYAWTAYAYYKNSWAIVNGHKYYFNEDGYAVTGWQLINGRWYYFEPTKYHGYECACYKTDENGVQDVGTFTQV